MKRMIIVDGFEMPDEVLKNIKHQVIISFNSVSIFREYLEKMLKKEIKEIKPLIEFEGKPVDYDDDEKINYEIEQFIAKIKDIKKEFYLLEVYNEVSNPTLDIYLFTSKEEIFDVLAEKNSMNFILHEENENGTIYFFGNEKDFLKFIDKQVEYFEMGLFSDKNRKVKKLKNNVKKIKNQIYKNKLGFEQMGIFLVEKEINDEIEYLVFYNEDKAKKSIAISDLNENEK